MNRAERRRDGRNTQETRYKMTLSEINRIALKQVEEEKDKIINEALKTASKSVVVAFVLALESECGFKKKRIEKVLDRTRKTFEAMQEGTINTKEMLSYCKENLEVLI
jgi:hypothetical protein